MLMILIAIGIPKITNWMTVTLQTMIMTTNNTMWRKTMLITINVYEELEKNNRNLD